MNLIHRTFKDILKDLQDENLVSQDIVIFDLRNIEDKYAVSKEDCFIQIRGSNNCKHEKTDTRGYCNTCGAYYHPLGAESSSLEYYNHLYYIAQTINAEEVIFITERDYPVDFRAELFGAVKLSNKFISIKNKTFISKFGKHWSLKPNKFYHLHCVMFTNKKCNFDDFIVTDNIEAQVGLLLESRKGSKLYVGADSDCLEFFLSNTKFNVFNKALVENKKYNYNIFD